MSDIAELPQNSEQTNAATGPVLTLRQLSKGGDFIRSVQCYAGQINIIHGEGGTGLQPFRDALLGRDGPVPVSMRYGERDLLSSEVYAVGLAHYLWTEPSVQDVLRVAGAPAESLDSLLSSFGLEGYATVQPSAIGTDLIRRLAIACSFFSQAKVLLFDRPFAPINKNFWDRLALLLLDVVRGSSRIVVVTGLEKTPNPWKGTPLVRVEDVDFVRKKTAGFSASVAGVTEPAFSQMRSLLQSSKAEDTEAFFRTRPQIIKKPPVRAAVPEALQTEAIENPHLNSLLLATVKATPGPGQPLEDRVSITKNQDSYAVPRSDSVVRKRPANHLTRVTVVQKMRRRSPILAITSRILRIVKQSFTINASPEVLPIDKRVTQIAKRQKRNQKMLIQSIVAVSIIVATIWLLSVLFA